MAKIDFQSVWREIGIYFKQVFVLKNAWILLPGVMALVLVYAAQPFEGLAGWLVRGPLERLALWLMPAILLILIVKAAASRDSLAIYLAVLALVFLVRELDDTNYTFSGQVHSLRTKELVEVLLIGMAIWALFWHERLFASLNRSMWLKISLFGVGWTYFFSQVVSRRAFRGILPNERALHIPFEETLETAAHLFFLVVVLLWFPRRQTSDQDPAPIEAS